MAHEQELAAERAGPGIPQFVLLFLLAVVAVFSAASASAAEITYVSVTGTWRDPVDNVPGSQPGDPVITNGDPTSSISWGVTTGSQSGYDFTATLPPPFELPGPIPFFSLGDFQHRNFSVDDPSLVSVQLDVVLVLAVDGVPTGPLTFTFTFNHEETPNNPTPPDTCPYPTPPGEGCTDRVTIVGSADPTTFNVGGVDYTLDMSFLDNGSPVDEFITREGGTVNSSGLVGEFTLPPGLRVSKSGPAAMRLGQWGNFLLDVQNDGDSDAHDVTVVDLLPDGVTGGMCDTTPEILSAQVFAADGVTPVPGKGPLTEGSDYSLSYDGAACELTFNTLSAAAVIDIGERLLITYRTRLDTDSQDGITLTNVAGATAWFSDAASNPSRIPYLRTLTDGTVGVDDHEDALDVDVDLPVLRFEKTAMNVTTGENPATVATPGDTLRYTFLVENLGDVTIDDFSIVDELDALNATPGFAPTTLNLVTVPSGADVTFTSATGGAAGTGIVDIRNLSIGGLGEVVLVEFEVELAPVLADGSYVDNQGELLTGGLPIAISDDPNINGPADPDVVGDEDPTRVTIASAPYFDVDKVSSYPDGDPNVLLAGERVRYTITVKNVGTANATDARLRDALPAYTTYVADSTTLNGTPVADSPGGELPLIAGIDINAPEDPTAGYLRADNDPAADNVASIEFYVTVDPNAADGTILSNQAFVSSVSSGLDQPSDDPRTPEVDDPTEDVVGNYPLIFPLKTAALLLDYDSPDIVDPGDVLRYTILIQNNGAVDATMVRLTDVVPTDTTYVADSLTLNGEPVNQPDGGVFPLEAGIWVSSSDLTPPLPGPGEGVLSSLEAATVQFDVRVNDDVPRGTLITNQATVSTEELGDQLTDADGDPTNGPEPTIVRVGDAQLLTITKAVTVVGGGPALEGGLLEYLVTVRNTGAVPAFDVYVTDDLDEPTPGQLVYEDLTATLNGGTAGIDVSGPVILADYSSEYGPLPPGQVFVLRFQARIYDDAPIGTTIINEAYVTWNTDQTAATEARIDVGGTPGIGMVSGSVWHDADFDDFADGDELRLEGWTVEVLLNDEIAVSSLTDADGAYTFSGLVPNYETENRYEIRFRAPGAGQNTASLGQADSDFTDGPQRIYDIEIRSGSNLQNLNLPIDPNGVVYDALSRLPLAGARLTLVGAGSMIPLEADCFDDPNQQGQYTLASGYYKFDLNFSDPSCPSGGSYLIEVESGSNYEPGISQLVPPASDETTAPFNVPFCPGTVNDAIPLTGVHCEAQASEFAPPIGAAALTPATVYYLNLVLNDDRVPGSSQLFNNHIPLDPVLNGLVTMSKTTPMVNVSRGQMVPYTLTVRSSWPIDMPGVDVVDRYPVGFKYIAGSARLDGEPVEPVIVDGELIWEDLTLTAESEHTIELLLAPGAGVSDGEFVNRAYAELALTGEALSAQATATVRLVPDPTFDCTDVTGKVFSDNNRNGLQDDDEPGIQGARLVTPTGLAALTDQHGRFHITCAVTPREGRGSNFMLKMDDRTLPSGFRSSTRSFQIKRATRGKALHFSFGASIYRVVGLDVADPVFMPGGTELRPQWKPRVDLLMEELEKAPAILRLSYLADVEDERLVTRRVKALRRMLSDAWQTRDADYRLTIEQEIFWRTGKPPEKDKRLTALREADQ